MVATSAGVWPMTDESEIPAAWRDLQTFTFWKELFLITELVWVCKICECLQITQKSRGYQIIVRISDKYIDLKLHRVEITTGTDTQTSIIS